ncbi:MAG: hypothetical protein RJB26_794 [Pseudomonadota bacterium]|jgi:Holliday junction resolvase RusA-like endonuclease
MIEFVVPGQPVGKGRPRVGKRGARAILYTPTKTANYEGLIAHTAQAAMAGRPLIETPVEVRLFIDCQIPASWSQKKQRQALAAEILPTTKPDADNVLKALNDGLNGVVWRDDVQDTIMRKRYSATPGLRVQIRPAVTAAVELEAA